MGGGLARIGTTAIVVRPWPCLDYDESIKQKNTKGLYIGQVYITDSVAWLDVSRHYREDALCDLLWHIAATRPLELYLFPTDRHNSSFRQRHVRHATAII